MIEAVVLFGLLLGMFEFVVISMVPPKYRLRLLGSKGACHAVHMGMLLINMYVHWGTITGTMSATLAFVSSMVTVSVARLVYGTVVGDVRVRRGIVGYKNEELVL